MTYFSPLIQDADFFFFFLDFLLNYFTLILGRKIITVLIIWLNIRLMSQNVV